MSWIDRALVKPRLRDRQTPPDYETIAEIYDKHPDAKWHLYDVKGRKLGLATPEQMRAAVESSKVGRVKEVVMFREPFGELAIITVDGQERLAG